MGKIKEVEDESDFHEILESSDGHLVIVDFWASWCGPCRLIGPAFDKMAEEAEFDSVIFVKVDVDEVGELAEEYSIECMPTFMLFKDGKKVDEMAGANKDKLRELIIQHK